MNGRMDFEIVCPNDHEQTLTFSQVEFEAKLKSGLPDDTASAAEAEQKKPGGG